MPRAFQRTPLAVEREIKKFQGSDSLLLPRRPFDRLVRSIASKTQADLLFRDNAMVCLQAECEDHLVRTLMEAKKLASFSKRVTVLPRDIDLGAARCENVVPGK